MPRSAFVERDPERAGRPHPTSSEVLRGCRSRVTSADAAKRCRMLVARAPQRSAQLDAPLIALERTSVHHAPLYDPPRPDGETERNDVALDMARHCDARSPQSSEGVVGR